MAGLMNRKDNSIMARLALESIKVVEYSTTISGSYCGKLLADMGANVIKIEPPEGDSARFLGPFPKTGPHPEKSALFLYINTSKRGITLDLDKSGDLDNFKALLKWGDVLIDDHASNHLENFGLEWNALSKINSGLIYTSINPYGRRGTRVNVKGDELTLIHAGGLGNLLLARSEDIDKPPVKLGGFPIRYQGGISAAIASLAAIISKRKTGCGQMVDISLHDMVLNLIFPTAASSRYHGMTWHRVPDRPPAMGRMQTSDGYVILNAADDHHFRFLRQLMGNPPWANSDEWDDRGYRTNHLMDIAPMINAWMGKQKKNDIYHQVAQKGIPIGAVNSAKDVMESPQYAARHYFVEVDHPEAGKQRYAGWPYRMTASPPRVTRPAPLLGQHNEEVQRELTVSKETNQNVLKAETTNHLGKLPLEGIRVLDFSWVWAGPYGTMVLADLGAEVIKIEGHKRMDLLRRTYPWPLWETAPFQCPINQGMSYNSVNRNKKSLTLNLTDPKGLELAMKLVETSDVVIDNMRPGAMEKLGLGYEALRAIKPDIIGVTSSSQGYGGPQTQYLGFATVHHGIGGGTYISGYPEDHPTHGSPGDVDILNANTMTYAILAALVHRLQTGQGQFIDYSQCEGVSSIIGEYLLWYEMTGEIPERLGNAHPLYAPHNVYPCWGVDRWLALEIHTDEEFKELARVINRPELSEDPLFKTRISRKKHEKDLDKIIAAWTRERDRDWMVGEMISAGLMAAPSRDARDLYADPHIRERGSLLKIDHPEMGEIELMGPPWQFSGFKIPKQHAPLLGEHNHYILAQLLGLPEKEIEELRKKDIIL